MNDEVEYKKSEWNTGIEENRKCLQGEWEEDETGSRDFSNDGSHQRATCQSLEVISCFIEDFYGILAA